MGVGKKEGVDDSIVGQFFSLDELDDELFFTLLRSSQLVYHQAKQTDKGNKPQNNDVVGLHKSELYYLSL